MMNEEQLRKRVQELEKAINWVLTDAAYKAPEQLTDVDVRWLGVLRRAMV